MSCSGFRNVQRQLRGNGTLKAGWYSESVTNTLLIAPLDNSVSHFFNDFGRPIQSIVDRQGQS